MQVCLAISGIDPPCAITPNTVSFATRAASSVSMAIWIARANASLSLFALNRAFRTASLLTEQIKRVGRASSRGFVIQKIPRTSVLTDTCCKLLELSHRFRASSYSRTSTVHKLQNDLGRTGLSWKPRFPPSSNRWLALGEHSELPSL